MVAEVILLIVTLLMVWTYMLYPALVHALASANDNRRPVSDKHSSPLPSVSVIMSVFNEEKVIGEKVRSLLGSDYPADLIEFVIGSDASDDGTDRIIRDLATSDDRIKYLCHTARRGKSAMLNDLVSMANGEILIITDANVIFAADTVRLIVSCFDDRATGLCDATVTAPASPDRGIVRQENLYSRLETSLRRAEGKAWGAMTGPYGGCYAVRRSLFPVIPENTLADDLYAGLTILKKGYDAYNMPEAMVTEDTHYEVAGQFSRRIRIAAGSFQNLFRFGPFPSGKVSASFAFFSHKVLRWFTPLFLILFFMTTVILSIKSVFYFCLLAVQLILILLSALDLVLDRYGRKMGHVRYVTQFLLMNAALTAGFAKAIRGIKNGIWEPTKRDRDDWRREAE
jgi:cellulose synthase/poly-beta-1,6-N-acetylglucosamine synthase-like glycosyltransferase